MSGKHKLYKNKVRLQDAKDARRFMQRVINAYDDDRIETEKARAFGYLIKVFLDAYESGELVERVEELEENIAT